MIEYRITKHNDKILPEMWKEDWQLVQIVDWKMYWSRPIKKIVTKTKKEPQKIITKYFSENTVKGLCSFYKDLEELYFEWVKSRANNDKQNFVQFNESSEKSAWKKLWQFPKPVAEEMLRIAAAQAYGRIYDISEQETSKIMEPLRKKKHEEEIKREWFKTDEEKKEAEKQKEIIQNYIRNNPSIREEARLFIKEKNPTLEEWQLKETLIKAQMARIAKYKLTNK